MENILAQYSKIIFPVNRSGKHWLTAILDVGRKCVVFMDSLSTYTGSAGREEIFQVRSLPQCRALSHVDVADPLQKHPIKP